jgi:hypothetical protein
MMPHPDFAASDFAAWDQEFYAEVLANNITQNFDPQPVLTPNSLDLQMSSVSAIPPTQPTSSSDTIEDSGPCTERYG